MPRRYTFICAHCKGEQAAEADVLPPGWGYLMIAGPLGRRSYSAEVCSLPCHDAAIKAAAPSVFLNAAPIHQLQPAPVVPRLPGASS
jgi:hypothetical protein